MQLDEHTADAGVITRIEAFADTARAPRNPEPFGSVHHRLDPSELARGQNALDSRTSCGRAALATTFRAYGIDARVLRALARSGPSTWRAQRSPRMCVPALYTTEDIPLPDLAAGFQAGARGLLPGQCRGALAATAYSCSSAVSSIRRDLPPWISRPWEGARYVGGGLSTLLSAGGVG